MSNDSIRVIDLLRDIKACLGPGSKDTNIIRTSLLHGMICDAVENDSCAAFCKKMAKIHVKILVLMAANSVDTEDAMKKYFFAPSREESLLLTWKDLENDAEEIEKELEISFTPFDWYANYWFANSVNEFISTASEAFIYGTTGFMDSLDFALKMAYTWVWFKGYSIEANVINEVEKIKRRHRLFCKKRFKGDLAKTLANHQQRYVMY